MPGWLRLLVDRLARSIEAYRIMNYVVGVDIGGTFTDCVVVDEGGKVTIGKSLSTPADFSQGALNAAGDAAQNVGLKNADELLGATRLFFHACTVGDNAA